MLVIRKIVFLYLFFNCIKGFSQDTVCSPGVKDIYNFAPGDIFQYRYQMDDFTTGIGIPITEIVLTRIKILEKEDTGDSLRYLRQVHQYSYQKVFNGPIDRTNENRKEFTDTLVIIDSVNHKLNTCQDSLVLISSDDPILAIYGITDTLFARTNIFSDEKSKKAFGGWDNIFVLRNNHLEPGPGDFNFEEIYAEGLGLTWVTSWFFEIAYSEELTGYVKDGDTSSGFVVDLNIPILTLNQSVYVYPNPVTDELIIFNDNKLNIKLISIIDTSGKHYFTFQPGDKNEVVVNISELKKGLYFLSVYTEDNLIVKKILKR